jgi:hypothetical protein
LGTNSLLAKPPATCELSQKGWLRLFPQRHSVSRVSSVIVSPSGFCTRRSPITSSGPSGIGTATVGRCGASCGASSRRV